MKKTYYSYTVRVCEVNDTDGCNYHNENRHDDRNGWPSSVTVAGQVPRAVCEEFIGVAGDSNYVAGSANCNAVGQAEYGTVWVNGYFPYGTQNDEWCSGRPEFVPGTCQISGHHYSVDRFTPVNDACPSSLCDGRSNCSANLQTDQTEHLEETPDLSCGSCMSGSGAGCTTWQEYFISQYNSSGGCYASPYSIRQGQDFEVTSEQNVCTSGQNWTRTGTATRSGVTFVSGKQSNGSPVPLRTYIKSRINEIVANGVLSPTIVSFVKTTTTAGDPGSKVDTNMQQTMIEVMGNTSLPVPEGGTVNLYNSVYDTANYANAFQQFASFIRKTLIRTYNLPIVVPTGKTLVIQSVSKNGTLLVLGTDYTVDIPNKRITFKDSLAVTPNDQIRVVYFFM